MIPARRACGNLDPGPQPHNAIGTLHEQLAYARIGLTHRPVPIVLTPETLALLIATVAEYRDAFRAALGLPVEEKNEP
jgi:hypothetical protein